MSCSITPSHVLCFKEDTVVINAWKDGVVKEVSEKAGAALESARSALFPLPSGSVRETEGFEMPCRLIQHYNCAPLGADSNGDVSFYATNLLLLPMPERILYSTRIIKFIKDCTTLNISNV